MVCEGLGSSPPVQVEARFEKGHIMGVAVALQFRKFVLVWKFYPCAIALNGFVKISQ